MRFSDRTMILAFLWSYTNAKARRRCRDADCSGSSTSRFCYPIGRRLGVSRERARQLEARAKKKLKTRIAELSRGNDWLDVHDAA